MTKPHKFNANSQKEKTVGKEKKYYCPFSYYRISFMGEKPRKKTFRRVIIDKLLANVKDEIKYSIEEENFKKVIYTQKHVGTSAYFTAISNLIAKDCYSFINLAKKKTKDRLSYYYYGLFKHFVEIVEVNEIENLTEKFKTFLDMIKKVYEIDGHFGDLLWELYAPESFKEYQLAIDLKNDVERLKSSYEEIIEQSLKSAYVDDFFNSIIRESQTKKNLIALKDRVYKLEKKLEIEKIINNDNSRVETSKHMVFLDNFDIVFCQMYKDSDGPVLEKILNTRDKLISIIKKLNNGNEENNICIVALRKRPKEKTEDTVSLRGEWHERCYLYIEAFFPELLKHIPNEDTEEVTDIYGENYSCPFSEDDCPYAIPRKETKEEFIQESKAASFLKGDFIKLCKGNPYYFMQSFIAIDPEECKKQKQRIDIDNEIKKRFTTEIWEGNKAYEEFLEMLPLYLPANTEKIDYQGIYVQARNCYSNMVKVAIQSDTGVIKPIKIIKDTINGEYGEDIANGINQMLIDNYAIYVPDDQKEAIQNKNIEDIEFMVHDFVHYVYSDIKFFESPKQGDDNGRKD